MLLAYDEIQELLRAGVVQNSDPALVNGTSLDIRLGASILTEHHHYQTPMISLREREPLGMLRRTIPEKGYTLAPGEFILASSMEIFTLPLNISAELKLKSSVARSGITNLLAGWCDPGWNGSVMTLELQNCTRYHGVTLHVGDRIGQVVFFRHAPVPEEFSYTKLGRYNQNLTVEGVKP